LDTGSETFPENAANERLRTLTLLRTRLLLLPKSYAGPPSWARLQFPIGRGLRGTP
jgi:hypothetical protein